MSELITQQEYWDEVRAIAESCATDWDRETPWDEYADAYVWQTVDGHQGIIYTWYNYQVMTHSGNRDAWREYGELGENFEAQMAFAALRADVMEHLSWPEDSDEQ